MSEKESTPRKLVAPSDEAAKILQHMESVMEPQVMSEEEARALEAALNLPPSPIMGFDLPTAPSGEGVDYKGAWEKMREAVQRCYDTADDDCSAKECASLLMHQMNILVTPSPSAEPPATEGERPPLDSPLWKLCYVEYGRAWFTTAELKDQWGDDWNDAPYEHNAGTPYEWMEYMAERGTPKYHLMKVAYEGPFETPRGNYTNSPYSVEQINAGEIAWLRTE